MNLIGYINKVISPLVLILPKMSAYVKTLKVKDVIKLSVLPVCVDRYIKPKIRGYSDKVYTNFRGLNMPEDGIECESFTVISIGSLFVPENRDYLKVHLDNCTYNTVDK